MQLKVFYVCVHVLWKAVLAQNVICSPVLQSSAEWTWGYSSTRDVVSRWWWFILYLCCCDCSGCIQGRQDSEQPFHTGINNRRRCHSTTFQYRRLYYLWFWHFLHLFLPRRMECRRGLAVRILSICLSVRLSIAWIVTKRKKNKFRFVYYTKDHLA